MSATICSFETSSQPRNYDEPKNAGSSELDAEIENENLVNDSSFLGKGRTTGNSFGVITARIEAETKPEVELSNKITMDNSVILQDPESTLKVERTDMESKHYVSDKLVLESNTKSLEDQDDYHFKERFLQEKLKASKSLPSLNDERVDEDEPSQQSKRDHCECTNEKLDGRNKQHTEEIFETVQPTQATLEGARVSKENELRSARSEIVPNNAKDLEIGSIETVENDQIQKTSINQNTDLEFRHNSSDEQFDGENGLTTAHPTEFLHSRNDSMRDVTNVSADLELVAPLLSDSNVGKLTPIPNIYDDISILETEIQIEENRQSDGDKLKTHPSFNPPKRTNQTKIAIAVGGEQNYKSSNVIKDYESHHESPKRWHSNASVSHKQNLLVLENSDHNHTDKLSSEEIILKENPVLLPTNSDKSASNNDFKLDNLNALLQYNPSSVQPRARQPLSEYQNPEIELLQDVLSCSTPSRTQFNTVSNGLLLNDNAEIQADTDKDSNFKNLQNLLHDSIPSRIQSNETLDNQVAIEKKKIQSDTDRDIELKRLEDLLLESTHPKIQSDAASTDQFSNKSGKLRLDKNSYHELKFPLDQIRDSEFSSIATTTASNNYVLNENDARQANKGRGFQLRRLEDLLLESAPLIQSTIASDDQPSKKNDENEKLKDIEEILLNSTPEKIQSCLALHTFSSGISMEVKRDIKSPSSLQASSVNTSVPEQMVSTLNRVSDHSKEGHVSIPSNVSNKYVQEVHDPTLLFHDTNRLHGASKATYRNEKMLHEEGQQSVFSDATLGQEYINSMLNAKKQLKKIEDEIQQLKGIDHSCKSEIADDTSNYSVKKDMILRPESNCSVGGVRAYAKKKKESSERKKQGIEPPSSKREDANDRSMKAKKTNKARRKTSRKKQVLPEKGSRKSSLEPDGKEIPRRRYNHREIEMPPSPSESGTKNASNFFESAEQNPARNDPPMMVRGSLEAEGSPTHGNDDHSSVEKKIKRKKKHEKQKNRKGYGDGTRVDDESNYTEYFQDDIEVNMTSVVSSHMERGGEGWSVPTVEVNAEKLVVEMSSSEGEEIDKIPRHVHTKILDDGREKIDPWAEVPCSCCCRYLPHTLVVATTHAYRLDRADEKDRRLT